MCCVLNGSFRINTNKLTYQMCLLQVTQVDPLITRFLSYRFRVDPFMTQTHKNPCHVHELDQTLTPLTLTTHK